MSKYKKINSEFFEFAEHDTRKVAEGVRRFIDRDLLHGVFADGEGDGWVESPPYPFRMPNYVFKYIMDFIKQYRNKEAM